MSDKDDPAEIQTEDFMAALEDIAEVAPELIEYVLTYYPPELIFEYVSPEICQHLEALKKSLSQQERDDS